MEFKDIKYESNVKYTNTQIRKYIYILHLHITFTNYIYTLHLHFTFTHYIQLKSDISQQQWMPHFNVM